MRLVILLKKKDGIAMEKMEKMKKEWLSYSKGMAKVMELYNDEVVIPAENVSHIIEEAFAAKENLINFIGGDCVYTEFVNSGWPAFETKYNRFAYDAHKGNLLLITLINRNLE